MHHIYHTEGFILASKNLGETGKYYHLFTRELGLVVASAQGVRKMSSKLRFVLQDFTYVKLDLVRGKDFWRITSASKANFLEKLNNPPEKFEILINILQTLKRLLSGEETHLKLFSDLVAGLLILERAVTLEEFKNLEAVLVFRLLHHLGYIGENADLKNLIQAPLKKEILFGVTQKRNKILQEINQAFEETQL